jgi:hypothetical protein
MAVIPRKITFASQDGIDQFESVLREFLPAVLGQSYDDCLLTDESNLSDFAPCGLNGLADDSLSLKEVYAQWDAWIVPVICRRYHVEPFSPHIRLLELCRRIEAARRSTH